LTELPLSSFCPPLGYGIETSFVHENQNALLSLCVVVRPPVCLSVDLSVCRMSVTFVHPTQPIEIFRNVSTPFSTFVICDLPIKILRRSSQGNPSGEGLNQRGVAKYSDFWTFPRLFLGNGAR